MAFLELHVAHVAGGRESRFMCSKLLICLSRVLHQLMHVDNLGKPNTSLEAD